jgi:hypothetical protein
VWKRIHEARRDAGLIRNWTLSKVQRESGPELDYQYAVVHFFDSLDKLRSTGDQTTLNLSFSDEEQAILSKTADSRKLLRSDTWELVAAADPERVGKEGFDATMMLGLMTSKDAAAHLELEHSVWKKVWAHGVADGHLWNWLLWKRLSGEGPNMLAVHLYPAGIGPSDSSAEWIGESIAKVRSDIPKEQFQNALQLTSQVRDMSGVQYWTIVDRVDPASSGDGE